MISSPSVLDAQENESIEIFLEKAVAFRKPVILYSISKDSYALLYLARKAFAPGLIPFPLTHIDSTWKFKEVLFFRDETAHGIGFEPTVETNYDGNKDGVTELKPFERATSLMDCAKEDPMGKKMTEGCF